MVHRTHVEQLLRDGYYVNALPVLPEDVDASLAADSVMKVWADQLPGSWNRGTQLREVCGSLPRTVIEEVLRRLEPDPGLRALAVRSSVLAWVKDGHSLKDAWVHTIAALELLEQRWSRPSMKGRLDQLRYAVRERPCFVSGIRAALAVTAPSEFGKYRWRQEWMTLLITAGGEGTADALLPHVAAILKPSEPAEDLTVELKWVAACAATDAATVALLKALEANIDTRRAELKALKRPQGRRGL